MASWTSWWRISYSQWWQESSGMLWQWCGAPKSCRWSFLLGMVVFGGFLVIYGPRLEGSRLRSVYSFRMFEIILEGFAVAMSLGCQVLACFRISGIQVGRRVTIRPYQTIRCAFLLVPEAALLKSAGNVRKSLAAWPVTLPSFGRVWPVTLPSLGRVWHVTLPLPQGIYFWGANLFNIISCLSEFGDFPSWCCVLISVRPPPQTIRNPL